MKFKEYLVYKIPGILEYVTSPLRTVAIELTNVCQLRCEMCYAKREPKGFIHEELFTKIVDQLPNSVRQVGLGLSGEVLLHGEFDKLLHYLKDHRPHVWVGMNTNGMLINEHLEALSRLDAITVSLDGFDETNNEQRKGSNYQVIHDNIMKILALAQRPKVRLNMVITERNKHEFEEFYEYWLPKVNEVNFSLCFNEQGQFEPGSLWPPAPTGKLFCHEPFGYMAVLWDGRVVACCHDLNAHNVLGNVEEQSIKEVWHGMKFKQLRLTLARNDFTDYPLCRTCELWKKNPIRTYKGQ